jgi:hypothetical protein
VGEIFVPLPAPVDRIEPMRAVRSTLVSSSLQAIRARSLGDRYFERLPPHWHERVHALVAGTWLPMDVVRAHYEVLDAIVPEAEERLAIGREVADRVQGSLLATLARLSTGAGVTPWTGLAALPRLWDRMFQGGAVSVVKQGPKDALLDMVHFPLLDIGYFNAAFRGLAAAGMELFCRRAFVSNVPRAGVIWRVRISWA